MRKREKIVLILIYSLIAINFIIFWILKSQTNKLEQTFFEQKKLFKVFKQNLKILETKICQKAKEYENLLHFQDKLLDEKKITQFLESIKPLAKNFHCEIEKIEIEKSVEENADFKILNINLEVKGKNYEALEFLKALFERYKGYLKEVDFFPERDTISFKLSFFVISNNLKTELVNIQKGIKNFCKFCLGREKKNQQEEAFLEKLAYLWKIKGETKGGDEELSNFVPIIELKELKKYRSNIKMKEKKESIEKEFYETSEFKVSGVICGDKTRIAIINGKPYEEGDVIDSEENCKLLKVTHSYIIIECNNEKIPILVQPK